MHRSGTSDDGGATDVGDMQDMDMRHEGRRLMAIEPAPPMTTTDLTVGGMTCAAREAGWRTRRRSTRPASRGGSLAMAQFGLDVKARALSSLSLMCPVSLFWA
ncbi:hypothetical protein [Streptomyces regalis]|nr:hypothetical protein [Streptomyces regalis]